MDQLTIVRQECTKLLLEKRELLHAVEMLSRNVGLTDAINQLVAFHLRFGVPILSTAQITDRAELRHDLIKEESGELLDAIMSGDLVGIADGIADTIYVCIGTALELGIPLAAVWQEVHRTNMLKVGGAVREDGKILKPEGWQPPNIAALLVVK